MPKKLQNLGELIIEGLYAAISYEKGESQAKVVTYSDNLNREITYGYKRGPKEGTDTEDKR